jgi:hypothetical protein
MSAARAVKARTLKRRANAMRPTRCDVDTHCLFKEGA